MENGVPDNEIPFRKMPPTTTYSVRQSTSTSSSPSYVTTGRVLPTNDATPIRNGDAGVTVGPRATQTTIAQASPKTNTGFAKVIRSTALNDAIQTTRTHGASRAGRGRPRPWSAAGSGQRQPTTACDLHASHERDCQDRTSTRQRWPGKDHPPPGTSEAAQLLKSPTGRGSDQAAEPGRLAQFQSARNAPLAANRPTGESLIPGRQISVRPPGPNHRASPVSFGLIRCRSENGSIHT